MNILGVFVAVCVCVYANVVVALWYAKWWGILSAMGEILKMQNNKFFSAGTGRDIGVIICMTFNYARLKCVSVCMPLSVLVSTSSIPDVPCVRVLRISIFANQKTFYDILHNLKIYIKP